MRLRSIGSGHRVSWRWGHLADPPLCRATTSGNWRRSTWTSSPGAVAKITASSLAEGPRLTSMRLQNHSSNAPAKYTPGRCRVGAPLRIGDTSQCHARRSAIGDQDCSITGNDARDLRKVGQCRDVLPGVVIDHLDTVATGMSDKNAAGRRIESAVIKGAASGIRYSDHADVFQRHDRLDVTRERHQHSSGADGVSRRAYDGWESCIPSMRNHLDDTSVAQSLDGTV